jgi:hypothetical protein
MAHVFMDKNYSQVFRGGFFLEAPQGDLEEKKSSIGEGKEKKECC